MPRCTPEKYAWEARHDRRHIARRCAPQATLDASHDRRRDDRQCVGMVRLCRLWLFRGDDRRGIFPDARSDGVAVGHLGRLCACLFCPAIGGDCRRQLYRPSRTQGRTPLVDFADDDRHDVDGADPELRDDRHRRADPDHAGAAAAGIFGRWRVRQRRQFSSRTCRRAARLQRQLDVRHRRHDHRPRLAVRRHPDDALDAPAVGRLGLADPLHLRDAGWTGRALPSRQDRRHSGVHRGRKARDDADRRPVAPLSAGIAAGARHLDHLKRLVLHPDLHPDLWRQDAASAASDRVYRDPDRRGDPAIGCPFAGHWSDKLPRPLLMVITCVLFVVTPYPAFYLMATWPSLATCIIAVAWLQLVKGGYSGVLPSLMSEQFPVDTRAVGVAFGYSISVSMFGGLAAFFATWLIAHTGDPLSPSYYLMFTALLSLAALIAIQRRARPVPSLVPSSA